MTLLILSGGRSSSKTKLPELCPVAPVTICWSMISSGTCCISGVSLIGFIMQRQRVDTCTDKCLNSEFIILTAIWPKGLTVTKLTTGDLQIISRIAMFRGLKAETVEHIVAPATAVTLRPRELIVRQDDPATAFIIVIDGWVKLYRTTPSGDDTVIEMLTKGHSFAEAVAFTGNRYLATAEAVSEARVARIPANHIVRCIRQSPDIALGMIASASQHMHHLIQQVEQLKAQSGVQRVAELFARLRNIGVVFDASHVVVRDVAKLRQLANDDRSAVRGTLRSVRLHQAGQDRAHTKGRYSGAVAYHA